MNEKHLWSWSTIVIGPTLCLIMLTSACGSPKTQRAYLPPPPDATMRVPVPPILQDADSSSDGSPSAYPTLISSILATELSAIFDLPQSSQATLDAHDDTLLVSVLNAVTNDIIIPMVFEPLDQRQKEVIAQKSLQISFGDARRLYHLIIDTTMARVWQAASGEADLYADYGRYVAGRPVNVEAGLLDQSFVEWSGIDGKDWQQRVAAHLSGSQHPFFLLGAMTARYLHAHIFSTIGYLVAQAFAEVLTETPSEPASGPTATQLHDIEVDALIAELMVQAGLPLLGVDVLFSIMEGHVEEDRFSIGDRFGPCRRWRFFERSMELYADRPGADDRPIAVSNEDFAAILASRSNEQEAIANRRLASFVDGGDQPIQYIQLGSAQWRDLTTRPRGICDLGADDVAFVEDTPHRWCDFRLSTTRDLDNEELSGVEQRQLCDCATNRFGLVADKDLAFALCGYVARSWPAPVALQLLDDMTSNAPTSAALSGIFVGLNILRPHDGNFKVGQLGAIETAIAAVEDRIQQLKKE